jgi:hypothetical protein
MNPSSATLTERLRMVASEEALAHIGARIEDLADPEVRAAAIRADHPDLERALHEGRDEGEIDGQPMSIRLHFAMHEILANQLADNDPPEVYETAVRLREDGYGRHEVLHMVAAPLAAQIFATVTNGEGYAVGDTSPRFRTSRALGSSGAASARLLARIPADTTRHGDGGRPDSVQAAETGLRPAMAFIRFRFALCLARTSST